MRTMFQVMNQTAFPKVLRGTLTAALVLATASLLPYRSMQAQTPDNSQSTAAPGTKPMTAAPGTVPVNGINIAALPQNAITKYDNRYEVYGGLLFMNGQAGQNLAKRYDMGGAEVMGTYWLGSHFGIPDNHLGITADYRIGAGTSPVFPAAAQYGLNRILIYQNILSGGVQYRGPKNRYAAVDFHVLGGGAYGIFDYAVTHYPKNVNTPYGSPVTACASTVDPHSQGTLGLYCNHVAPYGTVGGSIDFNESARLAIRLQPDMIFEHFGTETREFFGISLGAVYRLGKVK